MKKLFCFLLLVALVFSLVACNPENTNPPDDGKTNVLQPLDLGEGFNADYYPLVDKIEAQSGKIDVVLLFEGTEKGWEAVANEYERLHNGAVVVNLDSSLTAQNYSDKLGYEINNPNTEWDIIQGNLTSVLDQKCLDMKSSIGRKNYYAGDHIWSEVLKEDAYITDKTGTNTNTYIMNSESLLTAWFYNTEAMNQAAQLGYRNKNNEVAAPVTWDDLISLCYYMKLAGYTNPLGISVDSESLFSSQFTWLLRVYGDLYWRNEYPSIVTNQTDYTVDLTSENPESNKSFEMDITRVINTVLDANNQSGLRRYCGPLSDKYADFLQQFLKMKEYLNFDAGQVSFEEMRNKFQTQSDGKSSPQILLDYAGSGLSFLAAENDNFKIDFFDYPMMESEYVEEDTLLRDVGGNGGYLSIITHSSAQNALNLDFMKFFMSPYGQSIYYNGLRESASTPKGLTLVDETLVMVPERWKEFFQSTDKISFTGLADNNPYLTYMIRGMSGMTDSKTNNVSLWQWYLSSTKQWSTEDFQNQWHKILKSDWEKYAAQKGWNKDCWINPGNGLD